jgi:hypothetical protein
MVPLDGTGVALTDVMRGIQIGELYAQGCIAFLLNIVMLIICY